MREMADLFEPSGGATSMTAPMPESGPGPECGPVNLEAEQALLGAILIENAALERITWFMKADYFAEPIHAALYEAAERLIAAGKVANPITVKAFLPVTKIGEISVTDYCVRLVSGAPGTAHAKDYAALIAALHYRREMIRIADNLAREARLAPPDMMVRDLLKKIDHSIDNIRERLIFECDRKSMRATGDTLIATLSDAYKKGTPDGISWPFQSVAEIVSGPMEFGNLYKLIGSPKEGKTSFTLHVVRYALDAGHPVLILTFDQTADQVLLQMACQKLGLEYGKIRRGDVTPKAFDQIDAEIRTLTGLPLEVERERAGAKAEDLIRRIRLFAKRHKPRNGTASKGPLIIIDHQQKITPVRPADDAGRQAASILQAFKSAAEEAGAAIFMLDQRNAEGSKRLNPRPIEADVPGKAGGLQDCDAALYIYQPFKWCLAAIDIATDTQERRRIEERFCSQVGAASLPDLARIVEIGVLASRYGPSRGRTKLTFDAPHMRFGLSPG